ncbi:diguanylate cyclase (GGDEF) domain-containing protein [Clostridium cavendishii DSM 21758]|uniref:Diguanylate cyclase (GGDEF) domain-containing protein n=1 Tax=Clostridium cavendishii DSM 21758 TaxID=1121302 RepID=A0A1M6BAH6_9CLOT|nr:bifunctional diguanylate cyclase/phosphodiesterase [Clostridium cavendishii]SHI45463.1 diguanylate cyclase (GGDEF) domain-containing protein [Clostridium cavendishii DSM 21758]
MRNMGVRGKINISIIVYLLLSLITSVSLRIHYLEPTMEKIKIDTANSLIQSAINFMDIKINELSDNNKKISLVEPSKTLDNNITFLMIYDKNLKEYYSYINGKNNQDNDSIKNTITKIISSKSYKDKGIININYIPTFISIDRRSSGLEEYIVVSGTIMDYEFKKTMTKDDSFDIYSLYVNASDLICANEFKSKNLGNIYKFNSVNSSKFLTRTTLTDIYGQPNIEIKINFDKAITPKLATISSDFYLISGSVNTVFIFILLIFLNISVFNKIDKINKELKKIVTPNNDGDKEKVDILSQDILSISKYVEDVKLKADFYSERDSITGLYNRETFLNNRLFFEISNNYKALIYINIDGFSIINKTQGFENGNNVLKNIGIVIKQCLSGKNIVGRVGGDEFAILMESDSLENVETTIKNIIYKINNNIKINNKPHFISCSVGIEYCYNNEESPAKYLNNAYEAMLTARSKGINNYSFFKETEINLKDKITLDMLQNALENGDIMVYYQPKVDVKTTKIYGVEALARWIHPTLGYIPPNIFIELAEKTGYILTLGNWILEKACRDIMEINEEAQKKFRVSVNVSAIQLIRSDYFEDIKNVLEKTGIDPTMLELEITETAAIGNFYETNKKIEKIKELGITISIDDFGTGYSTLTYLAKYKVNVMKMDKSIVDVIDTNEEFIRSVISMIHSIGAIAVAEGVETFSQYHKLKEFDCDLIQGYYFYKPVSMKELKSLVLDENKKYCEL